MQLTTWNPTPANASAIPSGPVDYASKHWSGLIADYYAARAFRVLEQALLDAGAKRALDRARVEALLAEHAHAWTTATTPYPQTPAEGVLQVAVDMRDKYLHFFDVCAQE